MLGSKLQFFARAASACNLSVMHVSSPMTLSLKATGSLETELEQDCVRTELEFLKDLRLLPREKPGKGKRRWRKAHESTSVWFQVNSDVLALGEKGVGIGEANHPFACMEHCYDCRTTGHLFLAPSSLFSLCLVSLMLTWICTVLHWDLGEMHNNYLYPCYSSCLVSFKPILF